MALEHRAIVAASIKHEIYAAIFDPKTALVHFRRGADSVLIDIEWTDGRPLLAPLRELPGFFQGRQKV